MKNSLLFLVYVCCSYSALAQSNDIPSAKKELKYYKKHINEYLYKNSQCTQKDSIIDEQDVLISKLRADISALNIRLVTPPKTDPIVDSKQMPKGTSYQIQIGVYKNTDLTHYLSDPKYVGFELDQDLTRYHLGYFGDYLEAKHFLEIVRRMGIKDAFISEYKDGVRVSAANDINYATPINKNYIESKASTPTKPPVVKSTTTKTTPVSTNTSANNTKLEKNWAVKKDDDGNEMILVTPSNTKATTKTSSTTKSNEGDENMDINKVINYTKPATVVSKNPTNTSTAIVPKEKVVVPKSTSTTSTSTNNANIKMEKNWEITKDDEGNDIIRIIPK